MIFREVFVNLVEEFVPDVGDVDDAGLYQRMLFRCLFLHLAVRYTRAQLRS